MLDGCVGPDELAKLGTDNSSKCPQHAVALGLAPDFHRNPHIRPRRNNTALVFAYLGLGVDSLGVFIAHAESAA